MVAISPERVMELLSQAFRVDFEDSEADDDDEYLVYLESLRDLEVPLRLSKSRINEIVERLSVLEEEEGNILYNERYFEILVREESLRVPSIFHDEIVKNDSANGLVYIIAPPSPEYLIFVLLRLSEIAPIRRATDLFRLRQRFRHYRRRLIYAEDRGDSSLQEESEFNDDLLFWLPYLFPRVSFTLQIKSERPFDLPKFEKLANAFLFNLGYNLDVALIPQRNLEDLVRWRRITRLRRSSIDEIDAPRREYIPDLVYYYQSAISTDSSLLSFLSYYHIMEYFFERVFDEDLIQRIRDKLTQPSFSYKRDRDIKRLIKEIRKSLQLRDENVTFNEREALRLTLERFLDVSTLLTQLREYDESLIEYLKTQRVTFSGGSVVDLENNDKVRIVHQITDRIYKTRNAIVHSKEGEKPRYIPFEHDKGLARELPLMRFIAEQIIVGSSKVL